MAPTTSVSTIKFRRQIREMAEEAEKSDPGILDLNG